MSKVGRTDKGKTLNVHFYNVFEQLQHLVDDMRQETDLLKSQVCSERTNLKNLEGLLQNNREKDFQTQLNQQEKSAEIQMLKDRLSLNESKM
jgi:hypothetical protein